MSTENDKDERTYEQQMGLLDRETVRQIQKSAFNYMLEEPSCDEPASPRDVLRHMAIFFQDMYDTWTDGEIRESFLVRQDYNNPPTK